MENKPTPEEANKRSCSPLAAILVGCGTIILLGMVTVCGLGVYGYRWGMQQLDEFAAEYEERGYERVTGQMINVSSSVDEPHVYQAQMLTVNAQIDADVALMCQVVEIYDTVNGDVDFFGQILTVKSGAVINGDINVKGAQVILIEKGAVVKGNITVDAAQSITALGDVEGEITGDYQTLTWPNRPAAAAGDEAGPGDEATPPEESSRTKGVRNRLSVSWGVLGGGGCFPGRDW